MLKGKTSKYDEGWIGWNNHDESSLFKTKNVLVHRRWWQRKSAKGTKKCIIKRRLKFDHYKSCVKFDHLQELCKKNVIICKNKVLMLMSKKKQKNEQFSIKKENFHRSQQWLNKHDSTSVNVNKISLISKDDKKI